MTPKHATGVDDDVKILSCFLTEMPTDNFLPRGLFELSITCCILPGIHDYVLSLYTKNLFLDHFIIQSTLGILDQTNATVIVNNALQWTRTIDDEDGVWTNLCLPVGDDNNWGYMGQHENVMDIIIRFETLNYYEMPVCLRHFMYMHGYILHV